MLRGMVRPHDSGPVDLAIERALHELGARLARLDDPFPGFDAWTVLMVGECGWRSPEEAALEIAAQMAGGLADYLELSEQVAVAGTTDSYRPASRSLAHVLAGCRDAVDARSQAGRVALLVDQLLVSALDQVVPGQTLLIDRAAAAYLKGLAVSMGDRPHRMRPLDREVLDELRYRERLLRTALHTRSRRHRQSIRDQLGLRWPWSRRTAEPSLRELRTPAAPGGRRPLLRVLRGSHDAEAGHPAPHLPPPPSLRVLPPDAAVPARPDREA